MSLTENDLKSLDLDLQLKKIHFEMLKYLKKEFPETKQYVKWNLLTSLGVKLEDIKKMDETNEHTIPKKPKKPKKQAKPTKKSSN